jgi:hypothetical protein
MATPSTARIIEKRLPHTTRAVAADQNGHPAKVKREGAAGEEEMGVGISLLLTVDKRG